MYGIVGWKHFQLALHANVDFCFSVVHQREQHQHSRPDIWELHQPLRHWPLQSSRLGKPLRNGCTSEYGLLPAHQPHPETRPLSEPAEPMPSQGHMTAQSGSLGSVTRGACSLRDVRASHAGPLHSALPTCLQ